MDVRNLFRDKSFYRNFDSSIVYSENNDDRDYSAAQVYAIAEGLKNSKHSWHYLIGGSVFLSWLVPSIAPFLLLTGLVTAFIDLLRSRKMLIQYDGKDITNQFYAFSSQLELLNNNAATWIALSDGSNGINFGRENGKLIKKCPKCINSNLNFVCISLKDKSIYFAPDAMLIETKDKLISIEYSKLKLTQGNFELKEQQSPSPKDATTVRSEHLHLTTKNLPDKRRKENPIFPVNDYSHFTFSKGMFSLKIIASRANSASTIKLVLPLPANKSDAKPLPETQKVEAKDQHGNGGATINSGLLDQVQPSSRAESPAVPKADSKVSTESSDLYDVKLDSDKSTPSVSHVIPKPPVPTALEVNKPTASRAPDKFVVNQHGTWIPKEAVVTIKGYKISGGLFYVFDGVYPPHPGAINVRQNVVKEGDYSRSSAGYYPSYDGLSTQDKGAYLAWLSSGRNDPIANITYVFIYFYGLERRLLVDINNDSSIESEVPVLVAELERLLSIYSDNRSFRGYATRLLEFTKGVLDSSIEHSEIAWQNIQAKYLPIKGGVIKPKINRDEFSLALVYLAEQRMAVDADVTFLWANAIDTFVQPEIKSNPGLYYKVFSILFSQQFPSGFIPKIAHSTVHANYSAAAAGLGSFSKSSGSKKQVMTADVNTKGMQDLVESINALLEPYWRFKRRAPNADTFIPYLHIPVGYWPDKIAEKAIKLCKAGAARSTQFAELKESFDLEGAGRALLLKFFTRLAEFGIYVEPNMLAGATTFKPEDTIILFSGNTDSPIRFDNEAYQIATIYSELACAVSYADGDFTDQEADSIRTSIKQWPDLNETERTALSAKVTLFAERPISFGKIKSRLAETPETHREPVVRNLVKLSGQDGYHKKELAMLEKVVDAFGLNLTLAELIAGVANGAGTALAADSPPGKPGVKGVNSGFTIDYDKIKRIQENTREISARLNEVFSDHEPEHTGLATEELVPKHNAASGIIKFDLLPDLTVKQASFLGVLLSKELWDRDELQPVAKSHGLMLDGVLDVINEKCWDIFDDALHEGESAIDLNQDIAIKILESRIDARAGA